MSLLIKTVNFDVFQWNPDLEIEYALKHYSVLASKAMTRSQYFDLNSPCETNGYTGGKLSIIRTKFNLISWYENMNQTSLLLQWMCLPRA